MKNSKLKIFTLTAIAMLFAGCAQISPTPSSNNIMDASHIEGETVTMEEEMQWEDTGIPAYDKLGLGNTSSDGFQSIYFGFDKYVTTMDMQEIVKMNVDIANEKSGKIKIEGNCDAYGSEEYNYALGLKRAKSIKDAMISRGIREDRIVLVSMGEANPACTASLNKDCMSQNRRADISLVK